MTYHDKIVTILSLLGAEIMLLFMFICDAQY